MKNQNTHQKAAVTAIVIMLIIGFFSGLHLTVSATDDNQQEASKAYWMNLAKTAWNYFEPDTDATFSGSSSFSGITDWDTGFYIQAVINAEKLGIINTSGTWGANDRYDKVLTFLETRPLSPKGPPYLRYSAITGQNQTNDAQVATDAGKLFVALNNLREHKPQLKTRIDNLVYNHTNYDTLLKRMDPFLGEIQTWRGGNVYDYYITLGFAAFWPQRYAAMAEGILNFTTSTSTMNCEGILLPKIKISCDPLLMSIFDFPQPDQRITNLTRQVYLAHEARYNTTGKFSAFGEGGTGLSDPGWVWEWTTLPDNRTWVVQIVATYAWSQTDIPIAPIVYLKDALGFLALYGTPYAQNMVNYIFERLPTPQNGFCEGIDEEGRPIAVSMGGANSLIISAAHYAIENNLALPLPPQPQTTTSTTTHSQTTQTQTSTPTPSTNSPIHPIKPNPTQPTTSPQPQPTITPNKSSTPNTNQSAKETPIALIALVTLSTFATTTIFYKRRLRTQKRQDALSNQTASLPKGLPLDTKKH